MLSSRQEVNNEILRYMESDGYHLAPGSKTPHTLDSWVFHYTNAAGNNDGIKIEIEDKEMVNRIQFHPMAFVEDKESLNVFSVNFEKSYCFA